MRVKKINIGEYLAKLQARALQVTSFARLANTLLNDEESSRDNHVHACNGSFAT